MVKAHWDDEELIENWTLNPTELELVSNKVGANQIGFAILLKYFQVFARFPASPTEISDSVISYIAQQLQILSNIYSEYNWQGRSISNHRASIRKLFGFRTATVIDGEEIVDWLKAEIIESEQRIEPITERAGTGTLEEEADGKGFTGDYTSNFWSCESLWLVQAGYEGKDREVIATIGGLV